METLPWRAALCSMSNLWETAKKPMATTSKIESVRGVVNWKIEQYRTSLRTWFQIVRVGKKSV